MSDPFLGEIQMFAGKVPAGWLPCDGRQLPLSHPLFGLLGTTYGGNGTTTFALPDLRGRVPIGFGQGLGIQNNYSLGQQGGEEQHTLKLGEMPNHTHFLQAIPGATMAGSASIPDPTMMLGVSQGKTNSGATLTFNMYATQNMALVQPMDSHTINDGPTA